MSAKKDSKFGDLSEHSNESETEHRALAKVLFWVSLAIAVIALVVLIIFSLQQLISGNSAFGATTTTFSGLLGSIIIVVLNEAFFAPQRAKDEREHQRKMDREKLEEQKRQLRKALYSDMVIAYCTLSRFFAMLDAANLSGSATLTPEQIERTRHLIDFDFFDSILQNYQLLFWQLPDAQVIATFYTIMKNSLKNAAFAELMTPKKVAEQLEWGLIHSEIQMAGHYGFDVGLLRESGDVTWKPCLDKLQSRLSDPEALRQAANKFNEGI
jgi:hypothetical protein